MLGELSITHSYDVQRFKLHIAASGRDRRIPPSIPTDLASFDGIVMRSSRTRRVRKRQMRNAAGEEMDVPLKPTITFDDPQAMRQAAVLGLGVTQFVVPDALPFLKSGALARLLPEWYVDAGAISIYILVVR